MFRQVSRRAAALASLVCAIALPAAASANRSRAGTATTDKATTTTGTTTTGTTTTGTTTTGTSTTGGAGLGGVTAPGGSGAPTTPGSTATEPGVAELTLGEAISASGNGITISATGSALRGQPLTFTGTAPVADAGSSVLVRYASASAPDGWVQAAMAPVGPTGAFAATWVASTSGRLAFTVTLVPPGVVPAADPPTATFAVQVFRSSLATIYGPGLWGHRTACGEHLRRAMLGVASQTVKCGTEVAVYYGGREIVVPVLDRGPYGSRAKWDLTEATAKALGVTQTATVRTIEPWPQSQPLSARS